MSATRTRRLRLRLPSRRPGQGHGRRLRFQLPRPSARLLAILAGMVAVLGLGWLWFRDSSLVSVNRVQVTGLHGPSVARIRAALTNSAITMSTLDVDMAKLRASVKAYPDVQSLTVSSQFPHGLVIGVDEEIPVAAVSVGGRRFAVDARGRLLRAPLHSDGRLPGLAGGVTGGVGNRFTDSGVRAALHVLGAAPFALLAHIATARYTGGHGVVLTLRNGPNLLFGSQAELGAKWAAAVAVLGAASSQGASYIDVSDPSRPAAGPSAATSISPSTSG